MGVGIKRTCALIVTAGLLLGLWWWLACVPLRAALFQAALRERRADVALTCESLRDALAAAAAPLRLVAALPEAAAALAPGPSTSERELARNQVGAWLVEFGGGPLASVALLDEAGHPTVVPGGAPLTSVEEYNWGRTVSGEHAAGRSIHGPFTARSGQRYILFSEPVGPSSSPVGLVAAAVDLDVFLRRLDSIWSAETRASHFVLTESGDVLFSGGLRPLMTDARALPLVREMRERSESALLYEWQGEGYLAAYGALPESGWLVVSAGLDDDVRAPVHRLAWGGGAVILGLATLIWLGLHRAARRATGLEAGRSGGEGEDDGPETRLTEGGRALPRDRAWCDRIMEAVAEGILMVDAEGRVLWANPAALRCLGYDRESEVIGRNAHQIMHHTRLDGVDVDRADCPLCGGLDRGEAASVALTTLWRRDRTPFLATARSTPIREDGQLRGGVIVFLDVTDIHAREAIQQAVFNASTDAYIIFDENLDPQDANSAALKLFRAADLKALQTGSAAACFAAPQTDGRKGETVLREALRAALETGGARLELDLLDGAMRPLPCEMSLVRVDLGGHRAVFANLHDLRGVRQVEDSLRRERQYLQTLLDTSPLGVAIVSADGAQDVVQWANPRAAELAGLRPGDSVMSAFVNPDDYAFIRDELARSGEVREHAAPVHGPAGEVRHLYLTVLPMEFEGGPVRLLWMADITTLKATERALTAARDTAEAATRAKSDFLARMSHEIRTPMNAILGMGYLCLQTKLAPKQKDYLNKIQDAAHALLGIINDILDFSRVDNDALALEKAPFRLNALLESVSTALAAKAEEKNLEFLISIDPHMPNRLVGDSLRLSQVLQVLVGNAIKFTERGEVMVRVAPESGNDRRMIVHFSVSDTGIGLSEEEQSRLFQPFSQADDSTTRRFGGTGLGLAISKRIVDLMGGRIWVESHPHEGSIFHFSVPLEIQTGATSTPWAPDMGFTGLHVLVVDDNPAALRVLAEQTGSLGFRVSTAGSGRETLEVLERAQSEGTRYSFVVLDWRMPELDGLETAHLIKNAFPPAETPLVILVSAATLDFGHEVLEENGIRACLSKPVSIPLLRDTCARLLEEEGGRQPAEDAGADMDAAPGDTVTGARVLLVEDNDINQEIARSLLEGAGVVVDVACDGAEAVRMVEQAGDDAYQMVFMDIQMPVMDGLEAARRIRAQGYGPDDLPIVAMTAHAQSSDREKSLRAGMNDHITKPLDPEQLRQTLRGYIKNIPLRTARETPDERRASQDRRAGAERRAGGARAAALPRRGTGRDADTRDIPGLSQKAGLESVGGNRALYAKLLRRFQTSCRDTVRDIRQALELSDEELAVRLAHTVKGVAASLGLMALSRAAAVTEKALKDKEPVFALEKTLLPVFGDELDRALVAVDTYLGALPDTDAAVSESACELPRRNLAPEQATEAAALLRNVIANLEADWGAVMEHLDQLTSLLECSDYAPRLLELIGHVEGFDIPQARSVARKLAEALDPSDPSAQK